MIHERNFARTFRSKKMEGMGEIVDSYEICFIIIRDSRTKVVLSFTFCFY